MFECTIDGLTLKRFFEALKDTCQEANFICDGDGCSMQAMDDSHVALVSTRWTVDLFYKYRCDAQVTLGLSVNTVLKALQPVKTNKQLVHLSTLKSQEEDEEVLHITIEDPEKRDSWHLELNLLTLNEDRLQIPEEIYSCVCTVEAKELQDLLKYFHSIAETVRIRGEKDSLVLSAKGENLSVTRVISVSDMQCRESFEQDFAVRYLSNFVKSTNLSQDVEIALSPGVPMRFTFRLPTAGGSIYSINNNNNNLDNNNNNNNMNLDQDDFSALRFYVAPKIDED